MPRARTQASHGNFTVLSLLKLSDNKLSNNSLASELVEKRSFLNQSQSRKLILCLTHLCDSFFFRFYSYHISDADAYLHFWLKEGYHSNTETTTYASKTF